MQCSGCKIPTILSLDSCNKDDVIFLYKKIIKEVKIEKKITRFLYNDNIFYEHKFYFHVIKISQERSIEIFQHYFHIF